VLDDALKRKKGEAEKEEQTSTETLLSLYARRLHHGLSLSLKRLKEQERRRKRKSEKFIPLAIEFQKSTPKIKRRIFNLGISLDYCHGQVSFRLPDDLLRGADSGARGISAE